MPEFDTAMPVARWLYGSHPSQYGDLYRPSGSPRPGIVVVIHGGFWRNLYDVSLGAPLCADLAARGYTAWNLEYRRVGGDGGWPATFSDIAAGIDLLATIPGLDTSSVITLGHSAGGQLAVWAACRQRLPAGAPGSNPKVAVTAAISQAGVLDLAVAASSGVGNGAVTDLLGDLPSVIPQTYLLADPIQRLPLGVPVRALHPRADDTVPFDQSESYVRSAVAAGDDAQLIEVPGGHMDMIDVSAPAWTAALAALHELLEEPLG